MPPESRLPPLEWVARSPAVALFLQRAQAVKPDFRLTTGNAPLLAAIVGHLDGLPLAIELAAARINLLPPSALLAHLREARRFAVLVDGPRDEPARHQTLHCAIAWSYDLLVPAEQQVFRCLAACAGGATLNALTAVVDDTVPLVGYPTHAACAEVLAAVQGLVAQSLVEPRESGGGELRFAMLESIRAYGLERLTERGEADAVRARHAATYLAFAEQAEAALIGPAQAAWLARLGQEHDNLRAALTWSRDAGAQETGLRLATALWRFWATRGYLSEGRGWLEWFLASPPWPLDGPGATLRARAADGAGALAFAQGDYDRAGTLHGQSLALYRALGDRGGAAFALNNLGLLAHATGDNGRAWSLLSESLDLRRSLGAPRSVAYTLNNLAMVARARGDPAHAEILAGESATLARDAGNAYSLSRALATLADVARDRGNTGHAAALQGEGLALSRQIGDMAGVASGLEALAGLAAATGRQEEAVRLFGAASVQREASGRLMLPGERDRYTRDLAAMRGARGADRLVAAWTEGRALPLDQALAQATAIAIAPPVASAPRPATNGSAGNPLSQRERAVLRLVARGSTNKRIAKDLYISEGTVKFHLTGIMTKLGAGTRTQAVALAAERGML